MSQKIKWSLVYKNTCSRPPHVLFVAVLPLCIPTGCTCWLQTEPLPPGSSAPPGVQEPAAATLPIGEIRSISTVTADRKAVWQSRTVSVLSPRSLCRSQLPFFRSCFCSHNWPVRLVSVTTGLLHLVVGLLLSLDVPLWLAGHCVTAEFHPDTTYVVNSILEMSRLSLTLSFFIGSTAFWNWVSYQLKPTGLCPYPSLISSVGKIIWLKYEALQITAAFKQQNNKTTGIDSYIKWLSFIVNCVSERKWWVHTSGKWSLLVQPLCFWADGFVKGPGSTLILTEKLKP